MVHDREINESLIDSGRSRGRAINVQIGGQGLYVGNEVRTVLRVVDSFLAIAHLHRTGKSWSYTTCGP